MATKANTAKANAETDSVQTGNKLDIWRSLEQTDIRFTKPFRRAGGFQGTDINPTWRMKRMTEQFGPVGLGWGYERTFLEIHEGAVFVGCKVWWRQVPSPNADQFWTGEQFGGNELVKTRNDGRTQVNDEALKMAMTDAVGKCVSQLGLSADVYLGQFDDSKYREFQLEQAKGKPSPVAQAVTQSTGWPEWADGAINALGAVANEAGYEEWKAKFEQAFKLCKEEDPAQHTRVTLKSLEKRRDVGLLKEDDYQKLVNKLTGAKEAA